MEPDHGGRLSAAVNVAEAALDAAKDHTAVQHTAALRSLVMQLTLVSLALILFGAMMAVTRRVRPTNASRWRRRPPAKPR
jgi:hypothetical protein